MDFSQLGDPLDTTKGLTASVQGSMSSIKSPIAWESIPKPGNWQDFDPQCEYCAGAKEITSGPTSEQSRHHGREFPHENRP